MDNLLTREQLKLYKVCITDGSMYCHECSLYKIKGGCAELVCNTALSCQYKAERQAAVLEQAKKAILAVFREAPSQESFEYAESVLVAIEGVQE